MQGFANKWLQDKHRSFKTRLFYFQEHQLRLWVFDQHVNKGLAPTTGNMNMEFDRIHAPLAAFDDPTSRGVVALSRNRMWPHRFRKNWDMLLGKVPARDFMSIVDIIEKVAYGDTIMWCFVFL